MRGLSNAEMQLINALKDLHRQWDDTATNWHDKARADFNADYIEDVTPPVKAAINAMMEINRMLSQAVQECS